MGFRCAAELIVLQIGFIFNRFNRFEIHCWAIGFACAMSGYFILFTSESVWEQEKKHSEKLSNRVQHRENLCQNVHNRFRRPCPTQLLELHDRFNCALRLFRVIPHRIQLEVMAARNLFRDMRSLQALHHPEVLFTWLVEQLWRIEKETRQQGQRQLEVCCTDASHCLHICIHLHSAWRWVLEFD